MTVTAYRFLHPAATTQHASDPVGDPWAVRAAAHTLPSLRCAYLPLLNIYFGSVALADPTSLTDHDHTAVHRHHEARYRINRRCP